MTLLTLFPPHPLGDFPCRMRGPRDGGSDWFVQDRWPEGGVSRIDVDVEVPGVRFNCVRPDFLQTTHGIPLLSARFVQNLEDAVLKDVDLVPARLHLKGATADFHALRIRSTRDLVDAERSSFFTSRGQRVLARPTLRDVPDDFWFARDTEFRTLWVASPRIGALIAERRLHVSPVSASDD